MEWVTLSSYYYSDSDPRAKAKNSDHKISETLSDTNFQSSPATQQHLRSSYLLNSSGQDVFSVVDVLERALLTEPVQRIHQQLRFKKGGEVGKERRQMEQECG